MAIDRAVLCDGFLYGMASPFCDNQRVFPRGQNAVLFQAAVGSDSWEGHYAKGRMMFSLAWGFWEEDWSGGSFHCVFRKSKLEANGDEMVHVAGLYRAADGETLTDIDTFQKEIGHREVIALGEDGTVRVRAEMAEQIAVAIAESFGHMHHAKHGLAHVHQFEDPLAQNANVH